MKHKSQYCSSDDPEKYNENDAETFTKQNIRIRSPNRKSKARPAKTSMKTYRPSFK